jgi:nickel transport protein
VRPRALLPLLAAACIALPVRAHEVTSEVARDRAVSVRATTRHGGGLAVAEAEVFSPSDDSTPFWKGRADRSGWVSFVPDAPGRWRVRLVDATGHGTVIAVDVAAPVSAPQAPSSAPSPLSAAWDPRTLGGVALVAAIFAFLYARGRGKDR